MLASVYFKPPQNFVKKIRDRINERLDLENEFNEHKAGEDDILDSQGMKRSEYVKDANVESYHNYIQGSSNLLDMDDDGKDGGQTNAIDELLGMPSTGSKP
jgi:hypothetical protein